MSRSVYVSTGCGCAMPGVAAALWRDRFERLCQAQFEKGGRVKPVATKVFKYVETRAPKLGRKIARILAANRPKIAAKVVSAYRKIAKADVPDDATLQALIDGVISDQGLDSLAAELGVDSMVDEIRAALLDQLRGAFETGAGIGLTEVGIAGDALPPMTEQLDVKAMEYAQERGAELIKDLAGTTLTDLRDVLAGAVEDGTSPADLADALDAMGAFGESRAEMIARTELAFAHVNGNVDGWRETGQVEGKRSILGDLHDEEDECDDCAKAGVVGLEDEFVDGYDFPPYHPRCVCDVLPVLADDQSDNGEDS